MTEIYTDGGCRKSPYVLGAYAYVVVENGEVKRRFAYSVPDTTSNIMELVGIMSALRYMKKNHLDNVTIYSDSQYSVNVINEWYPRWSENDKLEKKNIGLIEKIIGMKGSAKIEWVKGHVGIEYNEMADRLVNQAMDGGVYNAIGDEMMND